MLESSQWPDRVIFRYEKDDQARTVWLDDRKPTVNDWSLQGFSVGKYENGALIVHTTISSSTSPVSMITTASPRRR